MSYTEKAKQIWREHQTKLDANFGDDKKILAQLEIFELRQFALNIADQIYEQKKATHRETVRRSLLKQQRLHHDT